MAIGSMTLPSTLGMNLGSTSNSPVTFSGIVSGVNTAALIQSILAQKQQPITSLQNEINAEKAQSAAITEINGRLSGLLTAIQQFDTPTYLQPMTAAVAPGGTTPQVSATASGGAAAGSFKVTVNHLATATTVSSPNAIGAAIDPTAVLNTTNLATAITAGTFTVNGTSISVDPTTDTLNSVMSKIQAAIPGSTVSLVNDASGRPNKIQISSGSPVTLGSGADTSNFLAATNLLASPSGNTRTSTGALGVTQTTLALSAAHLSGALGGTSGSFTINGQTFNWDTSQQSLNNVISAINANTSAGVTAAYNPINDTMTLTSKNTGSSAIQLADTSGTFLQAMGLTGAQTLGQNAQYTIDTGSGPTTQYSTTNNVQNAVPGVTLNLLAQGTTADTVTIGQDVSGTVSKVQSLVTAINGVLDDIRTQTAINPPSTTPNSLPSTTTGTTTPTTVAQPPLSGDTDIQAIADNLHRMLTSPMPGVTGSITTLGQIGISFGAVGSAVGTTNDLVVDTNALTSAIQNTPTAVANLFSAFTSQAALQTGGAGNIASIAGTPTGPRTAGTYSITTALNGGNADMTAIFTPSNGGQPTTTTVSNLAPNSTTLGLIPGLTIKLPGAFTAGTDTINLTTPTLGLGAQFENLLTPLTQIGGVLASRVSGYSADQAALQAQINQMNDNLAQEKTTLVNKFAAMETAIQLLQTQQSTLTAAGLTGSLTANGSTFG